MKKIILCLFLLTTCLFANNYDDMFNELEGITSIVILDSISKKAVEGARVQVNKSSSFSNGEGVTEYNPSDEEVFEEKLVHITVDKENYIKYTGDFKAGKGKEVVYLKREPEKLPSTKYEKMKNKLPEERIKTKKVSFKVRVLALEDGDLYLADRKLKSLKSGMESFVRIKEGTRSLTLNTEKAIYRKEVNVAAPETLVVFTKGDIIKIKEGSAVKAEKAAEPSKEAVNKGSKKGKAVNSEEVSERITNEYLIKEIVTPLEDGSAFNILAESLCFEMEEDEDNGHLVTLKLPNGKHSKMDHNSMREARWKIGYDEFLDDYYYVVVTLVVELKKDYLNKVEKIMKKISDQEEKAVSTKGKWDTEEGGRYIAFSSAIRINNDNILEKLYKINGENSVKYSNFFKKLDEAMDKERKYRIRLYDNNSATEVINIKINSNQYFKKRGEAYYYDTVTTDLDKKKELYSTYSSAGSYLNKLNYNLMGSVYRKKNSYYFINNDLSKINVHLLKRNDGRKIIRSEYERVR